MKKNIKIFLMIILIIVLLAILTGCGNNETNESNTKEKVTQELDYLDTQIINILNKLNNITLRNYVITQEEIQIGKENSEGSSKEEEKIQGSSLNEQKQSDSQNDEISKTEKSNVTVTQMEPKTVLSLDENSIDWNTIKKEIETINDAWGVIVLDLTSINANNDEILGFSSTLNDTLLSIKNENKVDALVNTAKLYSFIPKFQGQVDKNSSDQKLKNVKSDLFNAYSLVEKEEWTQIQNNIISAINTFKEILNDIEYVKNKEYKVNKVYILMNELQSSLAYKDKKLFYLKYKNLIEEINIL